MSEREWKPGDVALVTVDVNDGPRLMYRTTASHWTDYEQDYWDRAEGAWQITDVRPLVVIDPEDREQVERLAREYVKTWLGPRENTSPESVEQMQAALREFANPTPPKPDEPQGLGAVVEDARGVIWIRADGADLPWLNSESSGNYWLSYADISAVRVLSEGVS